MSGTVVWALFSLVHYWFLVLPAGEMTFLYLSTSTEANHNYAGGHEGCCTEGRPSQPGIPQEAAWVLVDF